jgi:hypothetical protein
MSVDEAEVVVEQLGNGGMLSLEEGIVDATTAGLREINKCILNSYHHRFLHILSQAR